MTFLSYMLIGATVGFTVGLTGVGGGSLMTPALLALGIPLHTAVGTDLLFAAITKSSGAMAHSLQRTVRWPLVLRLASGSIPATIITIALLRTIFDSPDDYSGLVTTTLGFCLILTSVVIVFKGKLIALAAGNRLFSERRIQAFTPTMGAILGVLVTLSSVGAGAILTALLLVLFPRLSSIEVIGTGIACAVPLTLVAGLGHIYLGNVDFGLLTALLAGSVPSIAIGARLGKRAPEKLVRPLLATMLCGVGIKFIFF